MVYLMSFHSIPSDFSHDAELIDFIGLYATLDSLVDVSFDESVLDLDDALDYLKDIAFKCEN